MKTSFWIERIATSLIEKRKQTRPVVLITGARQTGKSSLLIKTFPEADYISLDNPLLAQEAEENSFSFLSRFSDNSVIIDEIQYAPSLFRALKLLVDEKRDIMGRWLLTGSQKFSLMKKASESLAGRISVLKLETFGKRFKGVA